jgi:hypothetical protein
MLSAKHLKNLVDKLNTNRKKDKRKSEIMVLKATDLDKMRASDIIRIAYNLKLKEMNFSIR